MTLPISLSTVSRTLPESSPVNDARQCGCGAAGTREADDTSDAQSSPHRQKAVGQSPRHLLSRHPDVAKTQVSDSSGAIESSPFRIAERAMVALYDGGVQGSSPVRTIDGGLYGKTSIDQ